MLLNWYVCMYVCMYVRTCTRIFVCIYVDLHVVLCMQGIIYFLSSFQCFVFLCHMHVHQCHMHINVIVLNSCQH